MNIILATTQVPFVSGGAEIQVNSLKNALTQAGHQAEIVAIPFKGYPCGEVLDSIPFLRLLNLSEIHGRKVDLLIGLKFPGYLIPHPNKVLWVIHQHRDAYDLWDSEMAALLQYPQGIHIRDAIHRIDEECFRESKQIFAESWNVAKRMKKYNSVDSQPLYHPPQGESDFYCKPAEDYLFFPSRLNPLKRQDLVVKALALTRNPVKIIFAGTADVPQHEDGFLNQIQTLKLGDRAQHLGRISEKEKMDLYSRALAVVYPPLDEDYGYVTLEAMLSEKPVVTCSDSGGTLEFVQDRENGWITEPTPEDLAACLDTVWENRTAAQKMGKAGRNKYKAMDISWKKVVSALCG